MEETYKLYTVILLLAATHFAQGFRVVSHFQISRHNRNVKARLPSNVVHVPRGFSFLSQRKGLNRSIFYLGFVIKCSISTETRNQISCNINYLWSPLADI